MRLPSSEKLEIIRLVEQSHLPARRTLEMLGVRPSATSPARMALTASMRSDEICEKLTRPAQKIEPSPTDDLEGGEVCPREPVVRCDSSYSLKSSAARMMLIRSVGLEHPPPIDDDFDRSRPPSPPPSLPPPLTLSGSPPAPPPLASLSPPPLPPL